MNLIKFLCYGEHYNYLDNFEVWIRPECIEAISQNMGVSQVESCVLTTAQCNFIVLGSISEILDKLQAAYN